MTAIEETIQQFGFSHQALADYLSVSVANMKLIATGRRELSTSASIKLAQLQLTFLNQDLVNDEAAVPKTQAANNTNPLLHAQIKKQEYNVEKYGRILADMQRKHLQISNRLLLLAKLDKQLSTEKEDKKDRLWLEVQLDEAKSIAKKHGPEAQNLLQWKIDCMAFAAKRAKGYQRLN